MPKYRVVGFRKARKILIENGYQYVSSNGSSHFKFEKDGSTIIINHRLNPMVWRRLVKENKLKE